MAWQPLIEQWFPAQTIGAESMRERGASSALPPVNYLHVWWARRPLVASRAAVLASLLPAWPTEQQAAHDEQAFRILAGLVKRFGSQSSYHAWFLSVLGIVGDPVSARASIKRAVAQGGQTTSNAYGYPRGFTVTPDSTVVGDIHALIALVDGDAPRKPVVLDPFSGGGSIPFEAARLGSLALANELNPVAAAILRGTLRYPALLGEAFADQIRQWGDLWSNRVKLRLAEFYPGVVDGESRFYIWAHTVPCPSTGRPTPLMPDSWLAHGKAGRDVATRLHPNAETGEIQIEIVEGTDAHLYGPISTYKRGTGVSVWTGDTFASDYIRAHARANGLGQMLLATCSTHDEVAGRVFAIPTREDQSAVEAAAQEVRRSRAGWELAGLVPTEEIPAGHKTDEPRSLGLMTWADLFTARQLLSLVVAVDELRRLMVEAREALDEVRADALNLYLAFALDKSADYNSRLSSWHATRMMMRNVFDRHDFSFKWSFAERDGINAALPYSTPQVAKAFGEIARLTRQDARLDRAERVVEAQITVGSAAKLDIQAKSVDAVVTDPPYYDNVMYAECSDFFYVWLKRSLGDRGMGLAASELTDKVQEAVANPSLFADVATAVGRGKKRTGKSAAELADEHYERLLTLSFREAHRVLKDDGVLTVMFTHKRVDAWDTLGQALLEGGFSIGSSWPVHTEAEHSLHQAKKNAANSTIFLACTKRVSSQPAYWDQVRADVQAKARWAVEEFSKPEYGLKGIDLTLATFGPVLSVLSNHWPVHTGHLDDAGEPVLIRPEAALSIAREEVAKTKKRGLLGGRDVEFDPLTDWWLLAWTDFQAAQFPSGEALKLSLAMHLDLDDLLKRHKVASSKSGNVEILSPVQRRTAKAFDQAALVYGSLLDALHALMLTYDEEGKTAAESWLTRSGYRDNQRFHDLVAMALKAVPRARDAKGTWARPEARVLEGLRATIFDDIPDPDVELARAREAEESARAARAAIRGKQLRLDGMVEEQLGFDDLDDLDEEGEEGE